MQCWQHFHSIIVAELNTTLYYFSLKPNKSKASLLLQHTVAQNGAQNQQTGEGL